MTAQERKTNTETLLEQLHIPINRHLPVIEEEEDALIRSGQDIAKRILVLTYLNLLAEEGDREEIIKFLKSEKLWRAASADEKKMFLKPELSAKEKIRVSWRSEDMWLMLWAINKVDSLKLPTEECSIIAVLELIPEAFTSTKNFIDTATLRSASEILDMSDLIYRLHWATDEAEIKKQDAPYNLNPSIVYERHYAINWITYYEENWDEITTDT